MLIWIKMIKPCLLTYHLTHLRLNGLKQHSNRLCVCVVSFTRNRLVVKCGSDTDAPTNGVKRPLGVSRRFRRWSDSNVLNDWLNRYIPNSPNTKHRETFENDIITFLIYIKLRKPKVQIVRPLCLLLRKVSSRDDLCTWLYQCILRNKPLHVVLLLENNPQRVGVMKLSYRYDQCDVMTCFIPLMPQ